MPLKLKKFIGCPLSDVIIKNRATEKKVTKKGKADELTDNRADLFGKDWAQDPELMLMRNTIVNNPEIFILNNLMMCVQFFKNFDEEIRNVKQTLVSSRETNMNTNFLSQKSTMVPDVLQEHIDKNVKFTSARQLLRPTIEPLQPIRVYVLHENIDVSEQNDSHHYTMMNDALVYNVWLKPSNHEGFFNDTNNRFQRADLNKTILAYL